jgi:hypothetical protein
MNGIKRWLIVLLLLSTYPSFSQEVYHFTKALAADISSNYGREAIYTDPLSYQVYTKTLQTPIAGSTWGKNDKGEAIEWKEIVADSANRLINRGTGRGMWFGRSGYMYLTYTAEKERTAILNIRGNSSFFFNGVSHAGDPYNSGWLYIPVQLKKGLNELYVRGVFVTANLQFPAKPVTINAEDATLPSIVLTTNNQELQGAVVIINTTPKELKGLQIRSKIGGKETTTNLPAVLPMATRKVPFKFDGSDITSAGKQDCQITLISKGKVVDSATVTIEAVTPADKYSTTFISGIDGSLQYYAVAPQTSAASQSALFLSVHGAGVEAIGQARAYQSKDWGTLVAATNRRPRGFNW